MHAQLLSAGIPDSVYQLQVPGTRDKETGAPAGLSIAGDGPGPVTGDPAGA